MRVDISLSALTPAVVGGLVAALLTLAVLSYVFGENAIFRLAQYLFVGVAAGYAAVLAWTQVLWPRILLLVNQPTTYWYYGIFFALGLMLLARGVRVLSPLANLPLGMLFGIGAALALGGALTGSLLPQVRATMVSVSPASYGGGLNGLALALDAVLIIVGTLAVLCSFHYAVPRPGKLAPLWLGLLRTARSLGNGLIMVAFGALYAGALMSFFSVLMSRIDFLVGTAQQWIHLLGMSV